MTTVVLDTNLYISALNFGGVPLEILVLGVRREITICISPSILEEIGGVLRRRFHWTTRQIEDMGATLQGFTRAAHPQERVVHILDDEPDNRILECAIEAGAHFIISGDGHLQRLNSFRGIPIVSPREFLESKCWLL